MMQVQVLDRTHFTITAWYATSATRSMLALNLLRVFLQLIG